MIIIEDCGLRKSDIELAHVSIYQYFLLKAFSLCQPYTSFSCSCNHSNSRNIPIHYRIFWHLNLLSNCSNSTIIIGPILWSKDSHCKVFCDVLWRGLHFTKYYNKGRELPKWQPSYVAYITFSDLAYAFIQCSDGLSCHTCSLEDISMPKYTTWYYIII